MINVIYFTFAGGCDGPPSTYESLEYLFLTPTVRYLGFRFSHVHQKGGGSRKIHLLVVCKWTVTDSLITPYYVYYTCSSMFWWCEKKIDEMSLALMTQKLESLSAKFETTRNVQSEARWPFSSLSRLLKTSVFSKPIMVKIYVLTPTLLVFILIWLLLIQRGLEQVVIFRYSHRYLVLDMLNTQTQLPIPGGNNQCQYWKSSIFCFLSDFCSYFLKMCFFF